MLPEIPQAHSAVLARRTRVLRRDADVGQEVVCAAAIDEFHGITSLSASTKSSYGLEGFPFKP